MQTAYCFFDMPIYQRKVYRPASFRFTSRDLDIMEFILEMKFATIVDIHKKFFRFTRTGQESTSLRWARERLAILVKEKMIEPLRDVSYKTLYVLTQKGYLFLRNSRDQKNYCRPLLDIDSRTFDHDQRVIAARIAIENSSQSMQWISERQLSEIEEVKKYLPTEFRPDAIYINSQGQKVAFELEITRKSKERYQQKIKRFINVMTKEGEGERIFDKVHYVCEKQTILELLKSEVQLYLPLFRFTLEQELFVRKCSAL